MDTTSLPVMVATALINLADFDNSQLPATMQEVNTNNSLNLQYFNFNVLFCFFKFKWLKIYFTLQSP